MRTALTSTRLERTLTELDHVRLTRLLQRQPAEPAVIGELLDVAQVVPSRAVGPDVVTMYSQVLLRDAADGTPSKITLCYPADAEPAAGFVSVLSPVAASGRCRSTWSGARIGPGASPWAARSLFRRLEQRG